jgi:hypothetical protein
VAERLDTWLMIATKHLSFGDLLEFVLSTEVMEALELFIRDPAVRHQGELNGVSLLCGSLDDQVLVRMNTLCL